MAENEGGEVRAGGAAEVRGRECGVRITLPSYDSRVGEEVGRNGFTGKQ